MSRQTCRDAERRYDATGKLVGMEILDASRRTDNPRVMEYAIAG